MKKSIFLLTLLFVALTAKSQTPNAELALVSKTLDSWHKAAADVKFDTYFSYLADDAVYIGTDATEVWNVSQFKAFAKPYFDKGKAWSFTALERNIHFNKEKNFAWFDELLDTQMKICRGSGVLRKENGKWKIVHYVLSVTVPNDTVDEVVKIKSKLEDPIIATLKATKKS